MATECLAIMKKGVMADFKLDAEDIDFLSSYDMVVSGLWGMIENDLPVLKEKGATVAFDLPQDRMIRYLSRLFRM